MLRGQHSETGGNSALALQLASAGEAGFQRLIPVLKGSGLLPLGS